MKFIINERQEKLLIKEFMQDGFSLNKLNSIQDCEERIRYCDKYLQEFIGVGSSRIVFEIGDDTVIKLIRVRNKFNIEQNMNDFNYSLKLSSKFPNLFPKSYQHADDYSWIITERVLPFKHEDCIALLGIPYSEGFGTYVKDYKNTKLDYNEYMTDRQIAPEIEYDENDENYVDYSLVGFLDWCERCRDGNTKEAEDDAFFDLMRQNSWFKDMYNFMLMTHGITDIFDNNLGLALRNNKPYIVILDTGYEDIKV